MSALPDAVAKALAQARQALADLDGVKLLDGKAVLEATVHHGDKGQSLQWLRETLDVQAVLFAVQAAARVGRGGLFPYPRAATGHSVRKGFP